MQACQFSRLHEALLERILKILPQHDRLASCATVCTSWAAAATAATLDVGLPRCSPKASTASNAWLQRHAGHLESLKVTETSYWATNLCLPCGELQRLTRLDLDGDSNLQLDTPSEGGRSSSSTDSSTSTAHVLPSLDLKLVGCRLSHSTLLQLSQLSGVTRLKLSDTERWQGIPNTAAAVKHLLQRLPIVARLSLSHVGDSPKWLQVADIIPALASSLTALTFTSSCTASATRASLSTVSAQALDSSTLDLLRTSRSSSSCTCGSTLRSCPARHC